jgi:hypothetical protein
MYDPILKYSIGLIWNEKLTIILNYSESGNQGM